MTVQDWFSTEAEESCGGWITCYGAIQPFQNAMLVRHGDRMYQRYLLSINRRKGNEFKVYLMKENGSPDRDLIGTGSFDADSPASDLDEWASDLMVRDMAGVTA